MESKFLKKTISLIQFGSKNKQFDMVLEHQPRRAAVEHCKHAASFSALAAAASSCYMFPFFSLKDDCKFLHCNQWQSTNQNVQPTPPIFVVPVFVALAAAPSVPLHQIISWRLSLTKQTLSLHPLPGSLRSECRPRPGIPSMKSQVCHCLVPAGSPTWDKRAHSHAPHTKEPAVQRAGMANANA